MIRIQSVPNTECKTQTKYGETRFVSEDVHSLRANVYTSFPGRERSVNHVRQAVAADGLDRQVHIF